MAFLLPNFRERNIDSWYMYAELIDQKIGQVYRKGVATKILQGMDRIRNEFDVTRATAAAGGAQGVVGVEKEAISA